MRFVLVALLIACADSAPHGARPSASSSSPVLPFLFADVTRDLGLDFVHTAGSHEEYAMPAVMGGGAAVFDYDGDGDLDLYLVDSGEHLPVAGRPIAAANRLYRQEADGRFRDVTAESGLGDRGYGMGCAVADIDNDGDVDVYVTNWGPDALYRNDGDGTFTDITSASGVANSEWGTSAVFFDYDRDGYLDLYVARYVRDDPGHPCAAASGQPDFCGPTAFPGVADLLYHNEPRHDEHGRRLRDVSTEAGVAAVQDAGLGVVAADFDDDGWVDVYVANDADANNLWLNQGDGTFRDAAVFLGAAYNLHGLSEAGMGVTAGDADGDGDLDLFVTHLIEETSTFYRNGGAAGFEDATAVAQLGLPGLDYTGFGTAFFDYDDDGDLDVAVVNGAVKRRPAPVAGVTGTGFWSDYVEPNQLLINRGDGTFVDSSALAGSFADELETSRGFLAADVDGDGDLDALVTNVDGPARLYRNETRGGNWLEIRPFLPELRREAVGARVLVVTAGGGRSVHHALPPGGYLTSGHARIHVGLADAERVDRFEVRWPGGERETFPGAGAGQVVELHRGSGAAAPATAAGGAP